MIRNSFDLDGQTGTTIYFDCNRTLVKIMGTAAGELTTISLAKL